MRLSWISPTAGGAYGFIAVPAQAWPMGHGSAEVTQVLRWFAFALVSHVGVALFGAFAHLSSGQRKALLASLGLYHVLIVADIVRRFLEVWIVGETVRGGCWLVSRALGAHAKRAGAREGSHALARLTLTSNRVVVRAGVVRVAGGADRSWRVGVLVLAGVGCAERECHAQQDQQRQEQVSCAGVESLSSAPRDG